MENYLRHYGVLGMKWGVRRSREQLGYRDYSPQKGDVTLKKGASFQRIATNSNQGFTKGVYTSYKKADRDLYKGVLGRMRISYLQKTGQDVALKEITMKAKKDIHLPSKDVRIGQFKKLVEEDPDGVKKLIEDHEFSRYGKTNVSYDRDYINKNEKKAYEKFNDALALGTASENGKVIKKYYSNLQKLGYDAIPDENDIRLSTFKAEAPIIMFNTKQSIGKVETRDLSASEVFRAYTRSIGAKTVRNIFQKGNIGFEKLTPDIVSKSEEYARTLEKDKFNLNKNYTLKDLANDWGKHRLSVGQIKKASDLMDEGKTHDEAVSQTIALGNVAVNYILNKFSL